MQERLHPSALSGSGVHTGLIECPHLSYGFHLPICASLQDLLDGHRVQVITNGKVCVTGVPWTKEDFDQWLEPEANNGDTAAHCTRVLVE